MKKLTLLFAISILFASCNEQSNSANNGDRKNKSADTITVVHSSEKIPADDYNTLFISENENAETIRIYTNKTSVQDKYFLTDDKNFMVAAKYQHEKLIQSDTIFTNDYTYTRIDAPTIQKKKIDAKDYVFLAIYEATKGNAITEITVSFLAINLSDLSFTDLVYTGTPSLRCNTCIDGSFADADLRNKSPLKKALYQYALQNKWVYNPTGKEKDISYYKNYEEKWNKDNNADNALANGHNWVPEKIYSTYYTENLFEFTGKYEKEELIENDRYKIVSYFRNNIIGYDKEKKMYFPIFIESCATGCNKTIQFTSANEIEVTYTEGGTETYRVKLEKIQFGK